MRIVLLNLLLILYSVALFGQIDTEFWFAAPEVTETHADRPILLRITATGQPAVVNISQPANPLFQPLEMSIPANGSGTIDLTDRIDMVENNQYGVVLNYGLHITSSAPITAYYEENSLINPELFSLKGNNALGKAFFVPMQTILPNSFEFPGISGFIVLAAYDNTAITITPSKDIVGYSAGIPFTIILNRGQTFTAGALGGGIEQHLTGSFVTSDKPIAVTIYDDSMSGSIFGGCADLGGDQLVPISKLGTKYIAVRGFLNPPNDKVFILATRNNTEVKIDGGVIGIINAGSTLNYDMGVAGAIFIESSAPVYVLHMSGFGCEVGLSVLPQIECTGSRSVSFTRSTTEEFFITLLVRNGGEGGFLLNGNPGIITSTSFSEVPSTDGAWLYAQLSFDNNQIPVETGAIITNSVENFHMGIIHGSAWGGCRFGYFSDFAMIETQITANGTDFCEGETLALTAGEIKDVTYEWTGPDGFTAQGASIEITSLSPDKSGYYILNGSNGYCPAIPDSILVTVHPLPANLGDAIGLSLSLQDSLVAWYPFNGNPDDETGNGNNGTVIGNVLLTTDRYGNANSAYEFPGEAFNYISVPHSSFLELNSFTISAWIFTETDYGYGQVVQKNRDIFSGHYGLYTSQVGGTVSYGVGVGSGVSFEPAIGSWHMVTGTLSGNYAAFYTDGQLVDDTLAPGSFVYSGTDPMAIGMHYYEGVPDFWTYPYRGKIDEILIYNRVLSAEEVACLYSGDCSSLKLSASLPEDKLCKGGSTSLTLFNAQPGVNYQLFKDADPYGNIQTGSSDTLTFYINELSETALFTVLATDTTTGCSITLDSTFIVEVKDVSAIAIANMHSAYIPAIVEVSAQSAGASTYEWLLDGVKFADSPESQIIIDSTGTHTLVLLVNSGPPEYCSDADTLYLTTTERIEVILEIPASFTPNADGINDYFEFFTEGIDSYTLWLKDPWGVLVNEYDKSTGKWNGLTTAGKEAPAGPYYYHIAAADFSGMALERSGVVYLIRDLIELSPNPAKDKLVIKMKGRLPGERSLQVMSVHGRVLAETTFSSENFELDISGFKRGFYLLRISNQMDLLNLKFIKE
jgi:gliding motility-associated-like protein